MFSPRMPPKLFFLLRELREIDYFDSKAPSHTVPERQFEIMNNFAPEIGGMLATVGVSFNSVPRRNST